MARLELGCRGICPDVGVCSRWRVGFYVDSRGYFCCDGIVAWHLCRRSQVRLHVNTIDNSYTVCDIVSNTVIVPVTDSNSVAEPFINDDAVPNAIVFAVIVGDCF